ncbi:hypothetical protein H6775_02760 [Candidatus Nomurabacteria bacterium]|nr:hypothetical protein [Candidatus Nomurabacteria bacterium]
MKNQKPLELQACYFPLYFFCACWEIVQESNRPTEGFFLPNAFTKNGRLMWHVTYRFLWIHFPKDVRVPFEPLLPYLADDDVTGFCREFRRIFTEPTKEWEIGPNKKGMRLTEPSRDENIRHWFEVEANLPYVETLLKLARAYLDSDEFFVAGMWMEGEAKGV